MTEVFHSKCGKEVVVDEDQNLIKQCIFIMFLHRVDIRFFVALGVKLIQQDQHFFKIKQS